MPLTAAGILELVTALADRLSARGVAARIYVVGGAAVALRYYPDGVERRATDDVDAVFSPIAEVEREADVLAQERGLPVGWCNNRARGYLPPAVQPEGDVLFRLGAVEVLVAPARLLLAMKLRACRLGRDDEDIAVLVRHCGISSMEEADALVAEVYHGEERIPPGRRSVVEATFDRYELTRAQPGVVLDAVRGRSPEHPGGRRAGGGEAPR